jgi:hypothetical protein
MIIIDGGARNSSVSKNACPGESADGLTVLATIPALLPTIFFLVGFCYPDFFLEGELVGYYFSIFFHLNPKTRYCIFLQNQLGSCPMSG